MIIGKYYMGMNIIKKRGIDDKNYFKIIYNNIFI